MKTTKEIKKEIENIKHDSMFYGKSIYYKNKINNLYQEYKKSGGKESKSDIIKEAFYNFGK